MDNLLIRHSGIRSISDVLAIGRCTLRTDDKACALGPQLNKKVGLFVCVNRKIFLVAHLGGLR